MRSLTKQQLTLSVAALLLTVSASAFFVHRHFDQRHQFRAELLSRVDELHDRLTQLQPGAASRNEAISFTAQGADGTTRGGNSTMDLPVSFSICGAVDRIADHFNMMPLPFVLEAAKDPQGFAAWATELQTDYRNRGKAALSEIARIKAQYQKDQKAFYSQWSIGVGETPDGEFYFSNGDFSGCNPERVLQMDFNSWIAGVITAGSKH